MSSYLSRKRYDVDPFFVELFEDFLPKYPRTSLTEFKDLLFTLEEKRMELKDCLPQNAVHPGRIHFAPLVSAVIKEARLVCKKEQFKKFIKQYIQQVYYADHDATPQNFYHPLSFLVNKKERNGWNKPEPTLSSLPPPPPPMCPTKIDNTSSM